MKKYKLAFLFTQPPFGSSISREGLDALLAASAFCDEEDILIAFLNDGVFNLISNAAPEKILQKDHLATFKLIELYDLSECFVCEDSVKERHLQHIDWILTAPQFISRQALFAKLQQAEKVLTF